MRRAHHNYGDKATPGQNSIIKKKCDTAMVIIANVYHYLQTEFDNLKSFISSSYDLSSLSNILKRTAEATGVSEQTVTSILEERKLCEDPEQEIVRTDENIIKFDDDEMR
ncbi:unnamed protein product [Arctia plantaginis]|uniref:Uncharacterized protein n=1 Tax=Arctia plantaginis TaxID=874455 RepID=A0A8S1BMY1_ARCPL|nr:unnamed protein product [Arctia plantaginis]